MQKIYKIILKYAVILLCLSNSSNINAQNDIGQIWECSTVNPENLKGLSIIAEANVDTSPKVVNTFFHVLRRNDGTGGLSQTQIDNWISVLCDDYLEHQIIIRVAGQSNLNNTSFYNGMTDINYPSLVSIDTHGDAIDIYLLSPGDTYARAVNIPGIALAVGGSYQGTSVLSHEFGHCLGLFHTHSGRGCNDYANCAENINGSNCSTCGDLVCDTPADPCLQGNVNTSCEYIGDPAFSPDVINIMSYSPPGCLSSLTGGQTERMHHSILNNSIFTTRSSIPTISDHSLICSSGATFTINFLPPVDSIIWEHGSNLTIFSGQYTDVCTIASTGSGSSWVRVRLVTDCGSIILPQKTVWSGVPVASQFDIRNVDFYGFNYLYEDMTNQLIANDYAYQNITEWEWDYGGWNHWEVTSTKYISFVDVPSFSYRDISVRAKNQCPGASSWYTERFYPYEGFFLIFSPNPSTGETVLSIESASTEKTFDETTEWELEVYSETQLLKERKTRLKGKNTTIQTYGWQDGIYLVRVKYKEELLTGKLMVKKR